MAIVNLAGVALPESPCRLFQCLEALASASVARSGRIMAGSFLVTFFRRLWKSNSYAKSNCLPWRALHKTQAGDFIRAPHAMKSRFATIVGLCVCGLSLHTCIDTLPLQ